MPRSQQARLSFDAGVLSPRMTLRADSTKHQTACQLMENFVVTPQGGALYRQGLQYISQPFNPADPFRVFVVKDGGNVSDTIYEIGPGTTRFWRNDQLIPNPVAFEIDNPYVESDLPDLGFTNQEDLTVLTSPSYPPNIVSLRERQDLFTLPIPFDNFPNTSYFDYKSPRLQGGTVEYTIEFGTGWVANDPFNVRYGGVFTFVGSYYTQSNRVYRYSTSTATMITTITGIINDIVVLRNNSVLVVANVTPTSYTVTVTDNEAGRVLEFLSTLANGPVASINITGGNQNTGQEPSWSYPYVVEHSGNFWTCILPHTSSANNEPGVGPDFALYWELIGASPPSWWDYQHGGNNLWVLDEIYSPWDRGFPSVAEFHEQRLILAGSRDSPTTIWASRIGVYNDFNPGPNDTDPIQFSIDTSDTPAIKWMTSTNLGLLLGTSAGEFVVSAQITLAPSDIQAQRQNYSRAEADRVLRINSVAFYVEQGGTKLRASQYSRDVLGHESIDASVTAEHLLQAGVGRLCMFRAPESMVCMLREDGQIVFMSYDSSQQLAAYSEGVRTDQSVDALIYDINTVYDERIGEDVLYACVRREFGYTLEKMLYPRRRFSSTESLWDQDAIHLDSWSKGTFTAGQLTITGLNRFRNTQVMLTVDDAVDGFYNIDAAGVLDLGVARPVGDYVVGYQYDGHIITYEHAQGNPAGVGFGTARRWNKLYARLLASGLPKINGQLPSDRTPSSLMNLPEPLHSEDVRVHNLGFGNGAVDLLQELPFPTHILGLYGEYGTNNV